MRLVVVPIGAESETTSAAVASALAQWTGLSIAVANAVPLARIVSAESTSSRATDLPRSLVRGLVDAVQARPVLAVTGLPLCDVRGNTIHGFAERGGRAGFVSYASLSERTCADDDGTRDWLCLLSWFALHETGHLGGLGHCGAGLCVMNQYVHLTERINPHGPFCGHCAPLWAEQTEDAD